MSTPRQQPHAPHAMFRRARAAGQGGARGAGRVLALAWLLLALLWAPTLGRMHQAGHAPGLPVQAARVAGLPKAIDAADAHATAHAHGWLQQLWAHPAQGGAVDCLLLDQLALGDALQAAPLALPAAVPTPPPPSRPAHDPVAQRLAQFQARGPPGPTASTTTV